ncbi:hypothetical protein P9112_013556 [Eukaryota sp. TZLM1-RC]
MDSYFDTIIHNFSEVTDGAPTCFRKYMEQADSINPSKLEPVSDFFDADALNNILTECSSVSTFRCRPNNFIQQFGEATTRKKKFRFMVTGDQSTELHQRPKFPVIAPIIAEKEQPVQVCSIDVLPDHIPTVDMTKRVNRPTRVVQEPSSSSQPMLRSASEDEVEFSGPSLDETPPPQPLRRRVSSEEPLRLEDLQASRNILDMSIASSLQRHVDTRPRSAEYKAPHLSEKYPLNKMSFASFLLKFQAWDKYGHKIANRSFQAPRQSDWFRAMLIATQIFGEGKTQITPELLSSLPSHIREEIDRDMKQPLLRIDPELTKRLGPPIHHYDLFKSMMISTCPSGLSSMVDPQLISSWQGQGLLRPDFSDADLMVFLLLRTQFTSYHEACSTLAKPCINWRNIHDKMDADNEFGRFIEDFGDVLRMTTYMVDHSISASIRGTSGLINLSPALIAEYFLLGIDKYIITKELASHWTRGDFWDPSTGTTLSNLISTTRRHFLAWCQTTRNRHIMELLRKQAERDEDILLGLSTMKTYSRGVTPSNSGAKRRSGGGSKGTPQNKYVPERHERDNSKFCTFCNVTEGNNPTGHTVFECKDPHCTRSKVPNELRFKIGEADQAARSGSVVRGRGGRGRRVSRFRGRGRNGHFRGHEGRGQYIPFYYFNTQEETSSISSPSENVSASSSTTFHRRIDRFSNRVRNTGTFPIGNKSTQSITIN